MKIYVFDFKIAFWALEGLCGALLGYFDVHFDSQWGSVEALWKLPAAPWRLIIIRQTPWIVNLELLKSSLRLPWSPFGAPEASMASKSYAQSSCGQNFLRLCALHSSFCVVNITF